MLVEAEAAQTVVERATGAPRGRVKLACPPGLVSYQIGDLLARFMTLYPEVEIQLESTTRRVDVVAEGFDLAIRVRQPPLEETDLVMRKLDESQHRLVASPQLAAERGAPQSPADLADWPSLDFSSSRAAATWELSRDDGRTAAVRHSPRLITDDLQMLHGGVRAGLGVALLPDIVVAADIEDGALIDLLPDWRPRPWIVHVVYPSRRGLLPSVRRLVDFLVEGCAEWRNGSATGETNECV